MYYFGYGSNMLIPRIRSRVPSAQPVTTARLDNYVLRFHKRSRDGSGKCNIVPDDTNSVYGVVFDVAPTDLEALDEAEQQGRRYRRQDVTVRGENTTVEAFAYVAESFYVDDSLLPYEWYHALVVAGARQHGLPESYVAQVASVRTCPDPDQTRREKHRTILEEAGYPLLDA